MLLGGSVNTAWRLMLAHSTTVSLKEEGLCAQRARALQSMGTWTAVRPELGCRGLGSKVAQWPLCLPLRPKTCWGGLLYLQMGEPGIPVSPWLMWGGEGGSRSWVDWPVARNGRGQHRPQDPGLRCFLGSQCRHNKVFFCQKQPNGAVYVFPAPLWVST